MWGPNAGPGWLVVPRLGLTIYAITILYDIMIGQYDIMIHIRFLLWFEVSFVIRHTSRCFTMDFPVLVLDKNTNHEF